MATCPECNQSSKDDPTLMTLEPVMAVVGPGSYSLAGVGVKVVAQEAWRLSCRCGWKVIGQIVGDVFVANQSG